MLGMTIDGLPHGLADNLLLFRLFRRRSGWRLRRRRRRSPTCRRGYGRSDTKLKAFLRFRCEQVRLTRRLFSRLKLLLWNYGAGRSLALSGESIDQPPESGLTDRTQS